MRDIKQRKRATEEEKYQRQSTANEKDIILQHEGSKPQALVPARSFLISHNFIGKLENFLGVHAFSCLSTPYCWLSM